MFWLHFEDLKHDVRSSVRDLAKFLKLDWQDNTLIDLVTQQVTLLQCSPSCPLQADISFMKAHQSKFDSHHIKKRYNIAMGLEPDAGMATAKVHTGEIGRGKATLSDRVIKLIDDRWTAVIEQKFGFKNYAAMRASINAELGRFPVKCASSRRSYVWTWICSGKGRRIGIGRVVGGCCKSTVRWE